MQQIILIVDDDPVTQTFFRFFFETLGYQCVIAGSAEESTAIMSRLLPSLILLDYSMPGVNGVTLLLRLKQDPRYVSVPVIGMSASEDIAAQMRAAGGQGFIQKGQSDWTQLEDAILRFIPTPASQAG